MQQSLLLINKEPYIHPIEMTKYILFDMFMFIMLVWVSAALSTDNVQVFQHIIAALLAFILYQSLVLAYYYYKFKYDIKITWKFGVIAAIFYHIQLYKFYEYSQKKRIVNLIERTRSSLTALDEAVILIDEQHLIEWWNPSAEVLFNIKGTDYHRAVVDAIQDQEFIRYFEDLSLYPTGLKIPSTVIDGRFTHIKLTSFGKDRRLLMAYDVTRLHNLEQMRKDFVDNISHELRTPLTVLSGYLENLSESNDMPARWGRAFEQMQQQTRRMNALVHDLLLLSHVENKKLQNENQVIHMADLMNQLFDEAQSYNLEYAHSLDLNLESHVDLIGSEMELASAFSNLITNAIKYTAPHGTITISWQNRGDEAIFSVQDTGIGIEPQHIPRLTERFYRVDSGRSRETGGTGLGLAIVKHVLAQHDAHLEIESEPQKGSIFKAVFPKHRLQTTNDVKEKWEDTR